MREVKRALFPLAPDRRREIIAEIKDDLYSKMEDAGIKTERDAQEFVKKLESPGTLAKKYIRIYGISWQYLGLLCACSIFLALISVPIIPVPGGIFVFPETLAGLTVFILTVFVVWTFISLGKSAWWIGGTVFITRTLLYFIYAYIYNIMFDTVDTLTFFVTSLSFLIMGYLIIHINKERETND